MVLVFTDYSGSYTICDAFLNVESDAVWRIHVYVSVTEADPMLKRKRNDEPFEKEANDPNLH